MGDSGKPFACTEIGCNQRFVNEDHLEVHRRKHEMSLGLRDLKSLDTPVIADQTPTPTRFLKNCVEEGLFNEHPNPFDALFRRASTFRPADAAETSAKGTAEDTPLDISDRVVEIDSSDNEQSLEDPSSQQAVSLTMGEETHQRQRQQSEESLGIEDLPGASQVVEVSTISPTAAQEVLPVFQQAQATVVQTMAPMVQNRVPIHQTIQLDRNTIPISGPILLRLPTGQTIPMVPPSVANPQAPIPVAISAVPQVSVVVTGAMQTVPLDSKSVKQKLKNNLLANQSQGNMGVMTQAVDVVTRQQGLSNPNLAEVAQDLSSPESQIKRRRRNSDMSEDEKREKFLERNRAAATRCRNKRKMWVNNLEQKADEYKSTNSVLMNEVTKLRDEVASLKQLLLAHNDCPVTIQQRQTGGNLFAALDMQKKDPSVGGDSHQSPQPEEANALPR
ncbi:cyclic AMP-dependent transcription factor ATF-2-like [Patiria miniata]|uniref:Cyclic AMP-dependent transcription factor ATF-2 n=1 Tax=Patiria miniata TaxID=46514 RepID=A0A913Z309_PATMI|nr:cyclic AMP-dependent transcription factor ATF-2-like [Patiria miniata]XP_038046092.1 cyclic AMP-dependent transcription factor ATF-2-like [Patiria miniata]